MSALKSNLISRAGTIAANPRPLPFSLAFVGSVALHLAVAAFLLVARTHLDTRTPRTPGTWIDVSLSMGTEGVTATPSDAKPELPTKAESSQPSVTRARTAQPEASDKTNNEKVIDLDNVVLSNDATGTSSENAIAVTAPPPMGAGRGTGASAPASAGGDGSAVVSAANLARRPNPPPNIQDMLEQNYPRRAQTLGVEGKARVRLRILPTGQTANLTLATETGNYEFGKACLATLRQSRWRAPLDKQGKPVATDIDFTCVFEIRY